MSQALTPKLPGAMPDRLPEGARPPADFDPGELGKTLLRSIRAGTLGSLDRNTGHPFASLVTVATDVDGSPVVLGSPLSTHTANPQADGPAPVRPPRARPPRCSPPRGFQPTRQTGRPTAAPRSCPPRAPRAIPWRTRA